MSRPYNFENIERFRDFPPKSYDSYSNWEKKQIPKHQAFESK